MGGASSKSKSSTEIINEVVGKAFMKSTQDCQSKISQQQAIVNYGNNAIFNNISFDQTVQFTLNCSHISKADAKFMNDFSSEIQNQLSAESSGLPLILSSNAKTSVDINNQIKNLVSTSVDFQQAQNCIQQFMQTQSIINYGNSALFNNVTFKQQMDFTASCIANHTSKTDLANKLEDIIKNNGTAVEKNFASTIVDSVGNAITNAISGLANLLSLPFQYIVGGIVLVILVSVYLAFGSGEENDDDDKEREFYEKYNQQFGSRNQQFGQQQFGQNRQFDQNQQFDQYQQVDYSQQSQNQQVDPRSRETPQKQQADPSLQETLQKTQSTNETPDNIQQSHPLQQTLQQTY